jgi:hypothetical protein
MDQPQICFAASTEILTMMDGTVSRRMGRTRDEKENMIGTLMTWKLI